ncbi:hypothetical protein [Aurantiacibacter poecillastricola]|jgi:hypothetical protein|uniref:hypothetical protein n=1 Tax=Aurantiacibacter poecillastricola TaxID=3064385 RepID=UPI00273FE2E5|nr:hypothetical protein [Aurantiacibacter sp. 219JJ12-13]MDP5263645.1 hypothetical protein [Aurantiacibacter sp. 219JJ12-13]|tara:strand:- start:1929 stop:2165 length:237 start_codon:yes stop_codon:yes gene_type:complete
MATVTDRAELDIQEQLVRIQERIEQSDKFRAESDKFRAERDKVIRETDLMRTSAIFQAMIASAALLGAGAALAKLFFP